MENKALWQKATQGLYQAVLINVCCSIAAVVFGFFAGLASAGSGIMALAEGTIDLGWGLWDYLELIANIGVLAAVVLFFLRVNDWKAAANANDQKAIGQIRIAMIISAVAVVISFIPLMGIIAFLASLAAAILQLLAYSALKNSTTLLEKAKEGAGKVYLSQILSIVGGAVIYIPLIGGIASLVCVVLSFIFLFKGWKLIANSAE